MFFTGLCAQIKLVNSNCLISHGMVFWSSEIASDRPITPRGTVPEALEGLQFECEQYDFAQDLHRIGGFGVVVGLLDHPEPEV